MQKKLTVYVAVNKHLIIAISYRSCMLYSYMNYDCLPLLGMGVLSTCSREAALSFPLLQLPLRICTALDPCTLNEFDPYRKLFRFGLSLYPPLILCLPKKHSTVSWVNFSVKTNLTPGCDKRYLVSSATAFAVSKNSCS